VIALVAQRACSLELRVRGLHSYNSKDLTEAASLDLHNASPVLQGWCAGRQCAPRWYKAMGYPRAHVRDGKVRMGKSYGSFNRGERATVGSRGNQLSRGTYLGEPVADLVTLDERDRVMWATQYQDVHAPLPHIYDERRTARRGASAVAGDFTSPHNLTYEEKVVRGSDSRICAQKEYYGSTLNMEHEPGIEDTPQFSRSSHVIGDKVKTEWIFKPHYQGNQSNSMVKSQLMHEDFMHRFAPPARTFPAHARASTAIPGSRSTRPSPQEFPAGNNDRNAWNRNQSNVGPVVFRSQIDRSGVPVHHKNYQNVPRQAGPNRGIGPSRNKHYSTSKAMLDDSTVRMAWTEGLYHQQDDHVSMRTVSADTPSWFQIPGVNIGKLNADQLRMLMEWKAPIPRSSMDASLKQSLEGSTDRARMYAKHQNCPFNCSHIGCAQAKMVIDSADSAAYRPPPPPRPEPNSMMLAGLPLSAISGSQKTPTPPMGSGTMKKLFLTGHNEFQASPSHRTRHCTPNLFAGGVAARAANAPHYMDPSRRA